MTTKPTTWLVFVHLSALPSWLALTRAQRAAVVADQVDPLLKAYPDVAVRWVDVESFTADCSDVLIAETADLRGWNHLFEALRDTAIFAVPYFTLERILAGIHDGYRDYEHSVSA
jgi:hypothetical protein